MKELKIGGLSIPIPVIQGGMGVGISLSGLASAVANEGGVGVISCAGLGLLHQNLANDYLQASILGLKEEIRKAKEKTMGILGVNIMKALTNFEDMVRTSIEEKVNVIFSGAGLPMDLPKFLRKDSVTKLVPIVSSGKAARLIAAKWKMRYDYWPDAFVVEGPKAGGHLGFKKDEIDAEDYRLEKILLDVLAERQQIEEQSGTRIPVIAAGGIYDAEDAHAIMHLGADGVQLGTRFVTTAECDASATFKQTYIDANSDAIKIIQSPVGMPGRAIHNGFIHHVNQGLTVPKKCPFKCIKTCDIETSPYCIMMALYNAYKGKLKNGFAFAGSNAYKTTTISTVKEVFQDLISGLRD